MTDILEFLSKVPPELMTSLLTAAIISLLAVASKTVRAAVFYTRHEVEFDYASGWDGCEWDVQWQGFRITIKAQGVSNDHIDRLEVIVYAEEPGEVFSPLRTSDNFHVLERWPLQFKLNSIVRTRPVAGDKVYRLFFVFRRHRWFR
jgi:hypothetical protein